MFGFDLSRAGWVAVAAGVYLAGRVLFGLGLVLWWYATDARRVSRLGPLSALPSGAAGAALAVALVALTADPQPKGLRYAASAAAAVLGFLLGVVFEFALKTRLWRLSDWLTSFRVPGYREQLLHADPAVRLAAAGRLAPLGRHARPARPELLAAVRHDGSADVRALAAQVLLYSLDDPPGPEDGEVRAAARAALVDPDPLVRCAAAATLVAFAAPPADVLPALCDGLTSPDPDVSGPAATALQKLGPAAEPAIPALKAAALHPDHPHSGAPRALGAVGAPAVPALVEILGRGDRFCRWSAADALGRLGEPARAALPALRKAAADQDALAGVTAKRAIKELGGNIG